MTTPLNPHLIAVRQSDWPIKVFYSMMRQAKDHGVRDILDIGSSVEVDSTEIAKMNKLITNCHYESLRLKHYIEYPSSWGIIQLREAVQYVFKRWGAVYIDPIKEVMITGGIIKAVDNIIQALDITHVVIPSLCPYFVRSLALLRGKEIIEVPLDLKTGNLDLQTLSRVMRRNNLTGNRCLLYLTLPSSPAGTVPSDSFIQRSLIPFALRHNIKVFCDTYIFATSFVNKEIRPLISYPRAKNIAVESITVSKEIGLPGIRMGAVAGNSEIINAMRLYSASSLEMLPTANQYLAAQALKSMNPKHVAKKLAIELKEEIIPRFKDLNWPIMLPKAGIDMLIRIPPAFENSRNTDSSLLAATHFLYKYKVGICPASVFGKEGSKWLRIVLKQADKKIPIALDRLKHMGFDWRTEEINDESWRYFNRVMKDTDLTKL